MFLINLSVNARVTPGERKNSNLSCSIKEKEQGASLYLIADLTKRVRPQ